MRPTSAILAEDRVFFFFKYSYGYGFLEGAVSQGIAPGRKIHLQRTLPQKNLALSVHRLMVFTYQVVRSVLCYCAVCVFFCVLYVV